MSGSSTSTSPSTPKRRPKEHRCLQMFGGESARPRLREAQTRLKQLAAAEGLPLSDREWTYNSRLAQELGVWATTKGKGKEFHAAVFRAYFVDGKNISDTGILVGIAASTGLDAAEARRVLSERLYKDAVDREWETSRAAGVTAVPTFEAGGQKVVGAQPYEELARLVAAAARAGGHPRD